MLLFALSLPKLVLQIENILQFIINISFLKRQSPLSLNIFYWWKHNTWTYKYKNFKMDWSTCTAYIKTDPLIQYIGLKYMSEIIQTKMNHIIKSTSYHMTEIIIQI